MNSNNIRTVELTISVGNIKAKIEELLRTWKVVNDDDAIVDMSFKSKAFDLKGKEVDVLPLVLKLKREEVEVRDHK